MTFVQSWYRDFLEDLRRLVAAGISILQALETIEAETKGRRATLAAGLRAAVMAGSTLAEAMAGRREVPPTHAAVIDAGERAGRLEWVLERLVARLDRGRDFRARLLSLCLYPVGCLALALVLLPLPLVLSGRAGSYAALQLLVFGFLGLVGLVAWKGPAWLGTGPGRETVESFILETPWLGSLAAEHTAGAAFSLLGLLIEAGVPLSDALPLAAGTVRFQGYARRLRAVEPRLRAGKGLAEALAEIPLLRSRQAWIGRIAVGEKAGTLDDALKELGDALEEGVWRRLDRAARIVPFILIPLVGLLVLVQALGTLSKFYGGL